MEPVELLSSDKKSLGFLFAYRYLSDTDRDLALGGGDMGVAYTH